jgi:hypothetical protein
MLDFRFWSFLDFGMLAQAVAVEHPQSGNLKFEMLQNLKLSEPQSCQLLAGGVAQMVAACPTSVRP